MIARRLKVKRRAELDIEEIERRYIAEVGKVVADDAVDEILAKAKKLSELPVDYRPGIREGTREYVMERYPYVLVYRDRARTVELLRVLHQRRSYFNRRP
ncbi:MAG: type II toxin-antitoxin system RelE/ParE family toxin [Burkholderiales bacterium]